jgi:serine/threonine protein phosphatase 1
MPLRLIGIGDIHGHLQKLQQLIELIGPNECTKLVFLGDYVCYGEDSKGVIDYVLQLRERAP